MNIRIQPTEACNTTSLKAFHCPPDTLKKITLNGRMLHTIAKGNAITFRVDEEIISSHLHLWKVLGLLLLAIQAKHFTAYTHVCSQSFQVEPQAVACFAVVRTAYLYESGYLGIGKTIRNK